MKSYRTAKELRAALASADRRGAGRPYPEELRRAAVTHWRERRRGGVSAGDVAAELGISGVSLQRWVLGKEPRESSFRKVELAVVVEPTSMLVERIVVHGRCGVRVEGLTVEQVAELLGKLP